MMNIKIGNQIFHNVQVPLLWGTRAIIQDSKGRISVINLGSHAANIEILGDKPAAGIEYSMNMDGFTILKNGVEIYKYNPQDKLVSSISLNLPDCQITEEEIRIGTNRFSGNIIHGSGIGIYVTEEGISLGIPLPANLATLVF